MRAAERGRERREREAAAELDDVSTGDIASGHLACEHLAARPQLSPVGQKLLVLERLLVEQRLGVARAQDRERPPGQGDLVLDEVEPAR